MRDIIEKQCEKSLPRFMEKGAPVSWQQRSILLSEAFAFCAVCDLCGVNVILESGVYLGRSTEIWANYFPDIPIFAVDSTLRNAARERLKRYSNVTLLEGDGSFLLTPY